MTEKKEQEKMAELLEAKKKSIARNEADIAELEKALELQKKKFVLFKEMQVFASQFQKKLEPTYEFETKEEYWNLVEKLSKIENELKFLAEESRIRQSERALAAKKEEVSRLKGETNE